MKRVVLMLALALVIPALATAADFTYRVDAAFSGCDSSGLGASFTSCTKGTTVLTFNYQYYTGNVSPLTTPGSQVTFGSFTSSGGSGSYQDFSGVGFTLNLYQILPGAGNDSFIGAVGGSLKITPPSGPNDSHLVWYGLNKTVVSFDAPPGTVTNYDLGPFLTPNSLDCLAIAGGTPCISLGLPSATINAQTSQVPEPASIMLFGSGLTGLAGLVRRRFKK